jgi:hypothetical protein
VKTLILKKLAGSKTAQHGTGHADAIIFEELHDTLKKKKIMRKKTAALYLLLKISNIEQNENMGSELF